jgi:hypothetical protein
VKNIDATNDNTGLKIAGMDSWYKAARDRDKCDLFSAQDDRYYHEEPSHNDRCNKLRKEGVRDLPVRARDRASAAIISVPLLLE